MEVYYWKKGKWDYLHGDLPTKRGFKKDYVKLPIKIKYERSLTKNQNLERTYLLLNGISGKNPLGSDYIQNWMLRKGVSHTSMSIGDIIKVGDHYYIVSEVGFKRLW